MNRMISFVLFLLLILVAVGFYQGWFSLTTTKEPITEKVDVNLQVDRNKMKQDATDLQNNTKSLLHMDKEKNSTER